MNDTHTYTTEKKKIQVKKTHCKIFFLKKKGIHKKHIKVDNIMGHSQTTLLTAVNTIVTSIFISVALECSSLASTNQITSIQCPVSDVSQTPENSLGCRNCFFSIYSEYVAYMTLQQNKWNQGGVGLVVKVDKPIEDDFHDLIQKGINCGLSMCKKCVASNLSQQTAISTSLTCQALNNIQNTLDQQLTAKITNQLENNRDLLAPLASLFGGDSSTVVANVVNRISTAVKRSDVNKIIQAIQNSQTINIVGGSRTVNVSQSSATNSVMTYLVQNNITNNILSQAEWDILLQNISTQNTLGTLGEGLVKAVSILADLATSTIGKVMYGILVAMGIILAGTIIWLVTKFVKRKGEEHKLEQQQQQQQNRSGNQLVNGW
jgi:hypothetical protein